MFWWSICLSVHGAYTGVYMFGSKILQRSVFSSIKSYVTRSNKAGVGKNDGGKHVQFPVLSAVVQLVFNQWQSFLHIYTHWQSTDTHVFSVYSLNTIPLVLLLPHKKLVLHNILQTTQNHTLTTGIRCISADVTHMSANFTDAFSKK